MAGRKDIPVETIAYIKYKKNTSVKALSKETGVSWSHIYHPWKEPVGPSHILHRLGYHCLGPCVSLAYSSDVCILVSRTCVN